MSALTKFAVIALTAITLLVSGVALYGPTDVEAAQDVADDLAGAALIAEQAAECQRRFGADAEVFVLEGRHTVCRPPGPVAGVKP